LATFFALQPHPHLRSFVEDLFVSAVLKEFEIAVAFLKTKGYKAASDKLNTFVIVDDDVEKQLLYKEMKYFCELLEKKEIRAFVANPLDLKLNDCGRLVHTAQVHISLTFHVFCHSLTLEFDTL
jgi:hypothetical protein